MSVRAESPGDIPRGWMWNNVRRAFPIPEGETEKKYLWRGKWCCEPPKVFGDGCDDGHLIVTVPTLVRSENHGRFTELPSGLPQALAQLRRSSPSLAVFVCVVAQDLPGNAWRFRALEDLERSWRQSGTGREIALVGIAADPASKIRALNATIALQDANGVDAVAWFDDDIELDAGVLEALWAAYSPSFEGVLGARKENLPDCSTFSRWWSVWKNRREPVNRYPHGCAMLVPRSVFGTGIPLESISDDHFYLFRLLRPLDEEPLRLLRVIPNATVRVPAVNGFAALLGRTFRNYRNVQRVMSGAPKEVLLYFLWELHFPGLRLPASIVEAVRPGYWMRLVFHSVKFCFFAGIFVLSAVRGLTGMPWRRVWYSAPPPVRLTDSGGDLPLPPDPRESAEGLAAR